MRSVECDRHVIAPGGSVVCREGAIAHLKAAGPVIYLRVPLEELKARIHNLDSRGIALEPGQTLEDIMDLRAPLYERYADAGGGRRPRTVHGPDRLLSARAPGTAGSGPHLARPQPTGNRGPAPEGRFSGGRMKRRKNDMTFQALGLSAPILTALQEQGYEQPSPIQEKAIPPALAGRDVLGCAQTGTGKTCAFAAPILQRLSAARRPGGPSGP